MEATGRAAGLRVLGLRARKSAQHGRSIGPFAAAERATVSICEECASKIVRQKYGDSFAQHCEEFNHLTFGEQPVHLRRVCVAPAWAEGEHSVPKALRSSAPLLGLRLSMSVFGRPKINNPHCPGPHELPSSWAANEEVAQHCSPPSGPEAVASGAAGDDAARDCRLGLRVFVRLSSQTVNWRECGPLAALRRHLQPKGRRKKL